MSLPEDESVYTTTMSPQPGFQTEVLICSVFEILGGGAKGGGKSSVSRMFMVKGNPSEPQVAGTAAVSYLMHPRYRGLVLRRNYDDLEDWVGRAREIYEHPDLGGRWFNSERLFKFPNHVTGKMDDGARVIVGHLAEEGAYAKWQGREFHRLNVEELTQIPKEDLYLRVTSCCRSTFKDLHPQIFNTTNPEGPGLAWVKKRWMFYPKGHPLVGQRVPPKTLIEEEFYNPITKKRDTVSRIFLPATVRDNKILLDNDPHYVTRLMAQPEAIRRAYLDGDWDILSGDSFFSEFRENHLEGEPDNAVHCVHSSTVKIQPYDIRWAGCDIGFNHPAVFVWAVKSEADSRVYLYRELKVRWMGAFDLGCAFARLTLPDIVGMEPPLFTLWLSPDAFSNRDASPEGESTSLVSRFSAGVRTIVGKQSVYVVEPETLAEHGVSDEDSEDFFYRKALAENAQFVIRRAPNQRVAGWNYMRELLNCRDQELGIASFDREYARKLLREVDGLSKYFKYLEAHQRLATRPELPRLRILSDRCPLLIAGIKAAIFADDLQDCKKVNADPQTGEGGDDEIDGARYCISGFMRSAERVPPSIVRQRKLHEIEQKWGGTPLLWQAIEKLNSTPDQGRTPPVFLHRDASHPARRNDANRKNQELHRHRQETEYSQFCALAGKLGS